MAFSRDGRLLASASGDQAVRLWDMPTGTPHGGPLNHSSPSAVSGVAFSPDGRLLASTSYDHTVRLWNYSFTSWVTDGCKIVGRNLSLDEWKQFVQGLPYERTCPELPSGEGAPSNARAAHY